ncbi:DUF2493 domain-containing protein [Mesorhizobium sp. M2D.F.Ca.ET.223.01.1.1]|uniref:DUF2493 domain-containing protein n=1 Tax=Mesorhizobium sp. M2D.F.Ca.ET.223.01.1.1 TaxID=2563940 RepID=UPI001091A84E|nr:DUF2493 domain-containing protein [Mesorhizobium sp. M2D.F.Ca.ET.223.01.1.1]TGR82317.1 DUF2493 domain-containing protein [Mesorhizobium sp. M2D.F.Ca.ET.223.01.1.1]TGT64419.1 DUF2493 domain-containing protein [bacterium M00.F.Ca.ET.159.01.1.1]TGT79248.1 DUF2493 domain-containing protein [bacterium M00.F.Ca.ET.157.01.1.1]
MRVLVCGGRDYADKQRVWKTLDELAEMTPERLLGKRPFIVIHGACRTGADELADSWAVHNYIPVDEFPADWTTHGKAAGPKRNQRMLEDGKPDLVVAFPGGRGTADMVRRAEAAGVKVVRVPS